ncbi:hypothetical protein RUM43_006443 [Polyplax serrata]|uniref:Cytosolic Fe-S cluster assembly factor NUBP2 homolog n=1 Tax=Polyplax serrata TaxID=468196 RepID=A0AAN8S262_POLSC
MLDSVKQVILVLSGKGGVGKSTVSTKLALALKDRGFKVGLLDIDLTGPSVPYLLGIENKNIFQSSEGWVPVYVDENKRLGVMSIGFLLNSRNDSLVWRGPKKTSMIKQFLSDVHWQDLDYLVIDTPPGTSDEHITVMENIRTVSNRGAIIVTTPQAVALEDVRKEISFCRRTGIPILGLVENMSGYACPHCTEVTNIFSKGGGESLAAATNVTFLGCLPLDTSLGDSADSTVIPEGIKQSFENIVNKLLSLKGESANIMTEQASESVPSAAGGT